MTPRYRLFRWNLMSAQAAAAVTIARSCGKDARAAVLWSEICEMRRTQAQEDLTSNPVL